VSPEIEVKTSAWLPAKTKQFMAKTKPGKKDLDSYTIKGTNKVVRRKHLPCLKPIISSNKLLLVAIELKIHQFLA
jgi:hypothetical protein